MLNTTSEASMMNTLAVMKINDVTKTICSKSSIRVIHWMNKLLAHLPHPIT